MVSREIKNGNIFQKQKMVLTQEHINWNGLLVQKLEVL